MSWLRYVDVQARTISVGRLQDGAWGEIGVHGEDERVRPQPFPEVELALASWWATGAA